VSLLEAVALGALQGLTEFLPVSSSGHLVLGAHFLGVEENSLAFDLALHLGSLIAVLVIYRRQLLKLVRAAFRGRIRLVKGRVRYAGADTRLLWLLVLATLPAAAAGALFENALEAAFSSPALVAAMLLVTGTILLLSRRAPEKKSELDWRRSLLIGCSQAFAIVPGLSRSGLTITAGMVAGLPRLSAADFSFLLSVPVILGAAAVKLPELVGSSGSMSFFPVLAGTAAAALSGFAAIRILLKVVANRGFYRFGWYCWALGLVSLLALALGA